MSGMNLAHISMACVCCSVLLFFLNILLQIKLYYVKVCVIGLKTRCIKVVYLIHLNANSWIPARLRRISVSQPY